MGDWILGWGEEHPTSNIEVEEGEEAASSRSVGILPTSSIPR